MFERADVWMGIANGYVWLYAPKMFTTTSADIPEKNFSKGIFQTQQIKLHTHN